MEYDSTDPFKIGSMVNTWKQSMENMMSSMPKMWPGFQAAPLTGQEYDQSKSAMEAMAATLKFWQSITSSMSTPETIASLFKGAQTIPDMVGQFSQALSGSFSTFQEKMTQAAARMGESAEAYDYQKMDESLFQAWGDIYQTEFRKFFQIPQIGIAREYQERVAKMLDRYNLYHAAYAELLRLMSMPFQRTAQVMQEELAALAEKGELPEDSSAFYQMWIKTLEGHFMTLFQTPEYIQAMSKTVTAMAEFTQAKDAVIEDLIKDLPIARQSEVDDLEKEVFDLKKRLSKLEKKIKDL